jgi:hypothetical protein
LSTTIFVTQQFRIYYYCAMTNFQDRMEIVISLCNGNQSELARRVFKVSGQKITAQTIQKLASRTGNQLSQGSVHTVAIAMAVGVRPEWLALGVEPMRDTHDLLDRTRQAIASGVVPKSLEDSFFSLAKAISETAAGSISTKLTAAEPDSIYNHTNSDTPKKKATG